MLPFPDINGNNKNDTISQIVELTNVLFSCYSALYTLFCSLSLIILIVLFYFCCCFGVFVELFENRFFAFIIRVMEDIFRRDYVIDYRY